MERQMKVLVAYASRYGSTKEIAERIAAEIALGGHDAEALSLTSPVDLGRYDAFVVGSAVFYGKWMNEAVEFVRRNAFVLSSRPTWLFSSGPIGAMEKFGGDQRVRAVPVEIPEMTKLVDARGHRVFYGRLDKRALGRFDSFIARVVGAEGDFRDWSDITGWAAEIAHALELVPA